MARFDIVSNRYGANIYEFMEEAQKSDYILLFGTESLKDKHDTGLSAVCTEFIHILRKRQRDEAKGLRRVFPILISGSHQTAFPPEYERYITVRDWRQGGYLGHFQSLFLELYQLRPERYLDLITGFLNESIDAFPEQGSEMRTIKGWYGNVRKQINGSTSLEEVELLPLSPLFEVDPLNQPMHLRQTVIARLKQCYLSQSEVTVFTTSEKLRLPMGSFYTQLAVITEEERKEKGEEVRKDIDGRLSTHETIFKAKKEITPSEIFTHEKVKDALKKRIMVFGSAGIGKTTFINYMLNSWANGGGWKEFHAIFSIRLRNLNKYFYPRMPGHVYTAKDILQREYSSLGVDFQALLEDQAFLKNSLLVLEGYDELPDDARIETQHLADAFKELKTKFPHILMTSRPGNVEFDSNAEFEILGFNDAQISRYISQYFDQMVQTKRLDPHEKEPKIYLLNQLMSRQPLAHSLAHIPINLSILCSIVHTNEKQFNTRAVDMTTSTSSSSAASSSSQLQESPCLEPLTTEEVPLTITALYSQIIDQFYKIFLLRQGRSKDDVRQLTRPRLDASIANIANVLEEIAFYAMEKGFIYVDQQKLEEIASPRGISLGLIRNLGLFKIEEKRG
ncbi:MAG: NACHT domain-containing protein [Chlamydiales bacterium]